MGKIDVENKKTGGRPKSPIPKGKRTSYTFESVEKEKQFDDIKAKLIGQPNFNKIVDMLIRGFIEEHKHLLEHGNLGTN